MLAKVRTPRKHSHDLSFSPFHSNKLACATGQFYGLAGSGSLFVITLPGSIGEPMVQTFAWSDSLFSVSWSEKNEHVVVAGGGDGSILIYDVHNPKGLITAIKGHSREVSTVHWCQMRLNSHLFLTGSWDLSIKLWNGETLQPVSTLSNVHDSLIYEVKSSPHVQGLFASCSGDGSVKLWSMNSASQPVGSWKGHSSEILSIDWCKYDQNVLATAATDGLVKVWDTRSTRQPKTVLAGHKYAVRRVRFSPHQPSVLVSSSYDFTVKTWDFLRHNHPVQSFNHHTEFVCALDFNIHTQFQLASGSWDETVAVWNINPS